MPINQIWISCCTIWLIEDDECTDCPVGQWSLERQTNCTLPTFEVLSWDKPEALLMMLAGLLVLVCQGSVAVVFFKHRETHLVKATGGALCFVALLSLMGACLSLLLFLGRPVDIVCHLQLPLTSILQTVPLSIITSISLQVRNNRQSIFMSCIMHVLIRLHNVFLKQIICVSEFPEMAASHLHVLRSHGSWLLVMVCCVVQISFSVVLEGTSLSEHLKSMKIDFVTAFLSCSVLPVSGFAFMQGFNSVMALISFTCTFMATKPLHQYNLARDITFSSLIYCVFWVTFIPIYIGLDTRRKSTVHVSFTLAGIFGHMAAYYFPKCYLLMRKPELNTAEHFCTFLEGVPPIPAQEEPQTQTQSNESK